ILSRYINNEVIFPSISNTFFSIVEIMKEPFFLIIIKNTLLRTFIGFSISLTIAIAIGVLSSISKIAYNFMIPILKFLNSIPTIAIILLALIWLNNELVPMFVGFIMVFPILYENILNSILDVDKDIIQMAKLYRVKKARVIKDIYMPSIIYSISKIFNSAIGINLKMVIAGEVLSQPKYSIGSSLQLKRMYLNTSGVFAWIILIILLSRVFDLIGNVIKYSLGNDRWM
ncbi:MAG: ABC transporter permease subunit, partial [Tissierella sp.]|nr:ABC transporter permease subunit [Tissierella sp.]